MTEVSSLASSSGASISTITTPPPGDQPKEKLGFWGKVAFVKYGWGMLRGTPVDTEGDKPGHLAPISRSPSEETSSTAEESVGGHAPIPGAGNIDDVREPDTSDDTSDTPGSEVQGAGFEGTRETMMSTLAKVATFVEEVSRFCYQEMVEESEVFQSIYQALRWVVIESSSLLHRASDSVPDLKDSAEMVYQRLDPDELEEESADVATPVRASEPLETSGVAKKLAGHLTQELSEAFLSSGNAEQVLSGCVQKARRLLAPLPPVEERQELLDRLDGLCEEAQEAFDEEVETEELRKDVKDCLKKLAATLPKDARQKALRKSFDGFSQRVDQALKDCAERRKIRKRLEEVFGVGLEKVAKQLERNPMAGPLLRDSAFLEGVQDEVAAFTTVIFDRVNAVSVQGTRERVLRTGANCLNEYCSLLAREDRPTTRSGLLRELERKQLAAEAAHRHGVARGKIDRQRYEHYLSRGILLKGPDSEEEPSKEKQRAHEVKYLTGLFLDVIEAVVEERSDSFKAPDFVYHAIAEQMAVRASEMLDQLSDQKRIDLAFYQATHMVQEIIGPRAFHEKIREIVPSIGQIPGMVWSYLNGAKDEWKGPSFVSPGEAEALVAMLKTATLRVATLPESVRGHFETFDVEDVGAPKKLQDLIDEQMAKYFIINDDGQQVVRTDAFNQVLDLVLQHVLEVGGRSESGGPVLRPDGADNNEEEIALFFGEGDIRPEGFGDGVPDGRLWDQWKCWPGLEANFGAWSALKKVRNSLLQHPDLTRNLVLIELEGALRETFPHRSRVPLTVPPGSTLPREYHRSESVDESDEVSSTDSSAGEEELGGGKLVRGAAKVLRAGLEIKDFAAEQLGESRVKQAGEHGLRAILEEFNDPFHASRVLPSDDDDAEEIEEPDVPAVEPRVLRQGFDKDRAFYADLCREELGPYLEGGLGITVESVNALGQSDSLDVFYASLGRIVVDVREALLEQMPVGKQVVDAAEHEAIEIVKLALQRFDAEAVQELREDSVVRLSKFMKIAIDLQTQLTQEERDSRSKRQKVFLQHLRHEGLLSDAISIRGDEVVQRKREQDHYAGAIQNLVEEIAAQRGYKVPGSVVQSGSRVVASRMSEILDLVTSKDTLDFALGHLVDQVELKFEGQTLTSFALQTARSGLSDVLRGKKTELPEPRPVLTERETNALVDVMGSLLAVSGKAPVASSLVRHQRKRVADVMNLGFDELLPSMSTVTRMLSDGTLVRVPISLDDFFAGEKPPESADPCWKGLESFASLYSILREVRTFWIENPRVTRAAVCTTIDGAIATWNERNDEMVTEAMS